MIAKRDVIIAVMTCLATLTVVASAQKAPSLMSSSVFDWEKIPVKETKTGASRDFFKSPTATLDQL